VPTELGVPPAENFKDADHRGGSLYALANQFGSRGKLAIPKAQITVPRAPSTGSPRVLFGRGRTIWVLSI
jgi:hypothetical protein